MKKNSKYSSKIIINNVIRVVLFNQLMSLLKIPHIIDGCFTSFLHNLSKKNPKKLKVLLESMWEIIPVSIFIVKCNITYILVYKSILTLET